MVHETIAPKRSVETSHQSHVRDLKNLKNPGLVWPRHARHAARVLCRVSISFFLTVSPKWHLTVSVRAPGCQSLIGVWLWNCFRQRDQLVPGWWTLDHFLQHVLRLVVFSTNLISPILRDRELQWSLPPSRWIPVQLRQRHHHLRRCRHHHGLQDHPLLRIQRFHSTKKAKKNKMFSLLVCISEHCNCSLFDSFCLFFSLSVVAERGMIEPQPNFRQQIIETLPSGWTYTPLNTSHYGDA